jgi:hypothetical protein
MAEINKLAPKQLHVRRMESTARLQRNTSHTEPDWIHIENQSKPDWLPFKLSPLSQEKSAYITPPKRDLHNLNMEGN